MKTSYGLLLLGALIMGMPATAQESSDEVSVWRVIEDQWERQERGDMRWIEEYLADDFMGWQNDSPAPRNKESERMWTEFASTQGKTVRHELYPLSIVVHDDMAIAHYLYTQANESKDGEVTVTNGRYTDVLVRDRSDWKFIAWHGGADSTED